MNRLFLPISLGRYEGMFQHWNDEERASGQEIVGNGLGDDQLDRSNQQSILRRVFSRSRVSAADVVLGEGGQYSYAEFERVVAFRQADWVGDVLSLALGAEAAPIWWTPKFDVESRESRNEETQQTVLGAVQEGRRSPA